MRIMLIKEKIIHASINRNMFTIINSLEIKILSKNSSHQKIAFIPRALLHLYFSLILHVIKSQLINDKIVFVAL